MLLRNGRKSRLMSRDARLVYNWLLVDQEISIFYDVEPLVATDGLVWSLPCPDELWNMSDTGQWAERLRAERRRPSRPSLHDVSLAVFNGKDMAFNVCDQTLRLLLYPIQSLITRAHTQAAGMSQAVDIDVSLRSAATQAHIMLRQWQDRVRLLAETRGAEVLSPTSRVLYHLVWVGTAASMGSIEALARADGSVGRLPCLSDTDVAASHSLRALDALRDMAPGDRPAWWPVAVYRCTLALWADAVLDAASPSKKRQPSLFSPPRPGHVGHADTCAYMPSSVVVGMDDDAVESALKTFWVEQEARIYNSTPPVEHQSSHAGVLARGISMLNQQPRSRLADGIIARLQRLKERWQSMDFAGFSL